MTWDPSITQRIDKALKEATDQTLIVDILQNGLADANSEIEAINRRVAGIVNAHRERVTEHRVRQIILTESPLAIQVAVLRARVRLLIWVMTILLVPIALPLAIEVLERFRGLHGH